MFGHAVVGRRMEFQEEDPRIVGGLGEGGTGIACGRWERSD
jgi:hypothetical protein